MSKEKPCNLKQAKILFNTLLKAQLNPTSEYKIYEQVFLPIILKNLKSNVMQGNSEACYTLAKVYEVDFLTQPKDEYNSILLTLIGYKLGDTECKKIVESEPSKYTILEYTANNFIKNCAENREVCFDDAVLLAALPLSYCETISNSDVNGSGNYFDHSAYISDIPELLGNQH
ncbi:hypothetical protein A1I_06710 [Rickettsia bellii OSU 85-389]|uniref:hypothetical protein n=1 Tax=Rickettsia bellii TaxID=33990 RepID=UPI0000DB104A|nr:hypothetical protein [Rickettsia bellii]ABV79658.1 hypothetical protein A1I_06710 [Rickettsia bellii OSU 85-389]